MALSATTNLALVVVILLLTSFAFLSSNQSFESVSMVAPRPHSAAQSNSTTGMLTAKFPKIIHTMWKSPKISPPAETTRWKKGCKSVNPDHEFKMYYDADLLQFVKSNYPEYLQLFNSLQGVYMADMARVLVIYHYGGIYMDLDFYCYRPFSCIVERLLPQTTSIREAKDILIVSLEPTIHANIFRDKERVVIQDFYMATARHPFFKWFLDDRLTKFLADPLHPAKGPFSYSIEVDIDIFKKTWNSSSSSSSSVSSTIISLDRKNSANDMMNIRISGDISVNISSIDTNKQPPKSTVNAQPKGQNLHTGKKITPSAEVQVNSSITVAPKGNFSGNASTVMLRRSRTLHSIRERYSNLKRKDQQKSNGRRSLLEVSVANVTIKDIPNVKSEVEVKVEGYGGEGGYIYELREDILHPLVDSTNPRLNTVCYAKGDGKGNGGIPSWDIKSCEKVRARNYFSPSEYTIAVHMWTHTFLGWSYFRGMYNSGVYADVERRLVPNMECPAPFIEGEK